MHSQARPASPLSRADFLVALLAAAVSLLLYYRTYVPWVLPSDSGEFQVLAHQLGVAHTTGYPVYLLLAKAFILLVPAPSIAAGVNLFSAFMAAATVGLVYLTGNLLTQRRWLPLFGASALAVGYTFWSQALIAEVYATGAACLAAVCVLVLYWYRGGSRWSLFTAGVTGGLGLGVHASLAMLAPAVVVFLLLNRDRRREWLMPALLGGATGLLLYLVAFLFVDLHAAPANIFNAAYSPARSNWDLTAEDLASPIRRIVFLMTAVQWRSAMFAAPLLDTPARLGEYLLGLPREFSVLTLVLIVAGGAALFRRDRRLGWFFASALLIHWACYFNYRVGDLYVFYIPGYVLLAMLATVGLDRLAEAPNSAQGGTPTQSDRRAPARPGGLHPGTLSRPVQAGMAAAVALVAVGLTVRPYVPDIIAGRMPFIGAEGYLVDRNTERAGRVALSVVERLEPDAIVFTDWYWLYPYYYAAHIELGRTGMQFVETYSRSDKPGLADSIVEFVQANYPDRPIYFSQRVQEIEMAGFTYRYVSTGAGQLYKLEYPR
jgi:hypothetical protein